MKLISWNVNGLRACLTHDFAASFAALDADVFSVQETKMQPGQAHHPDDAQQVVDVLVGDKDGAHLPPVQPGVLELMQHGHSAAAIHHKVVIAIAQNKTGIVALRYQCIARTQ